MLRQPKQQKRQTLNTLKFQANVYIYVVVPDIEYIKWYDGFGKLQINKYHTDVQFLILFSNDKSIPRLLTNFRQCFLSITL